MHCATSFTWDGAQGKPLGWAEVRESRGGCGPVSGVPCELRICQGFCFPPAQVCSLILEPLVWLRDHEKQGGSSLDRTKL